MKVHYLFLFGFVIITNLCACGGGNDSSTGGTPPNTTITTPIGTTVNLTTFKNVLTGTSTGSRYYFSNLTGTDSQGRAWNGSHILQAYGATTFEGQNYIKNYTYTSVSFGEGYSSLNISDLSNHYFNVNDGSIYKFQTVSGTITTPLSQSPIPSTPKVGDSGNIGTFKMNNGYSATATWALNPDINGASQFVISYVYVSDANSSTSTLKYTYYLDATGSPTKLNIESTQSGLIINIFGSRD